MSSWGGTKFFSVWYLISLITLGSPSKLEEEGEEGLRGEEGLTLVTLICDKQSHVSNILAGNMLGVYGGGGWSGRGGGWS